MKFLVLLVTIILSMSCGSSQKGSEKIITTTIAPIKFIVESITDADFKINVIVPPGASPETYEIATRQVIDIANSQFIFSFNLLDFEKSLEGSLESANQDRYIDLSEGLELIGGGCSSCSSCTQGIDPHVWTSINNLKVISDKVYQTIIGAYPDSIRYTQNYNKLIEKLTTTDELIRAKLANYTCKFFLIYHPSLGYYARDYGLSQIAIEVDGKEPNIREMAQVLDQAKELELSTILFQAEFRKDIVDTAIQDIDGGESCQINILSENILDDLIHITDAIANGSK